MVGAKLTVAREPLPAGRLEPVNEKPKTIPASVKLTLSNTGESTPVKSTPSTTN